MSTEPLSIAVDQRGRDIVVTLSGSADIDQLDELAPHLLGAASLAQRKLILVLDGLTFISSGGLGLLIKAHNLSRQRGVAFALTGVTPPVLRILQTTRLTKLLSGFTSLDDAIVAAGPGDVDTADRR